MSNHTSIRISPDSETASFAVEIRGRLQENQVVIAVEGDDDVRIDRKLFKKSVAIVPTHGVVGIQDLDVDLFETYPRNFIAIKDADFDHLNRVEPAHRNIFLTDKHDMEMTMIDCEIVESIIAEHLSMVENYEDICNGQKLIEKISDNLEDYSYIKWLNDVDGCNINFDVVTMVGLGADNVKVQIASALGKLYENAANNREEVKKISESDVVEFKMTHTCEDLALLVCGHDFTSAMLEWLRKNGSKKNMTRTGLESVIRLQYNSEKFRSTTLCRLIQAWERENDREIVA